MHTCVVQCLLFIFKKAIFTYVILHLALHRVLSKRKKCNSFSSSPLSLTILQSFCMNLSSAGEELKWKKSSFTHSRVLLGTPKQTLTLLAKPPFALLYTGTTTYCRKKVLRRVGSQSFLLRDGESKSREEGK